MDTMQQFETPRDTSVAEEAIAKPLPQMAQRGPMLVCSMKLPEYLKSYEEKGLFGQLLSARFQASSEKPFSERIRGLLRAVGNSAAPRCNWWTGEVLDVKQWADPMIMGPHGSAQCSEVWLKEVNGREFTIRVTGDYPVRPGQIISGLQVRKRWKGDKLVLVVNHSTRQYWDLGLPKANRTLKLFLKYVGVVVAVSIGVKAGVALLTNLGPASLDYIAGYAALKLLGPPAFFASYLYWHRLLRDYGMMPVNNASRSMLDYLNSLSESDVRKLRS